VLFSESHRESCWGRPIVRNRRVFGYDESHRLTAEVFSRMELKKLPQFGGDMVSSMYYGPQLEQVLQRQLLVGGIRFRTRDGLSDVGSLVVSIFVDLEQAIWVTSTSI
jgi:hypothetical protein